MELQETSQEIWEKKYRLVDQQGNPVDNTIEDTNNRVAKALASFENRAESGYWEEQFKYALDRGATPAGRIMSNAGAEKYKPATATINCTVSKIVGDSMKDILYANLEAGLTLKAGCGIGYEFSTLRPRGAFVAGAGAYTSGPLTFMDIFDKTCFTVSSAGGRRGAQMGTFAIWHPDVRDFIQAKREDGRLRQFNLSLLIDNEFMDAVINDGEFQLVFPVSQQEIDFGFAPETIWKNMFWEEEYCQDRGYFVENGKILCKVYETVQARELWDIMMKSTYDFSEPGFLLIDQINELNNNYFCETIRATNPCGEQPLPPYGSCLLGSINLAKFVTNEFEDNADFDWEGFSEVIHIFTRMLDNVVEMNGLPLPEQVEAITSKRRHGMGFLGLGSALSMMGLEYGCEDSIEFTENIMKMLAIEGFKEGIELAKEKGMAPLLEEGDNLERWISGKYIQQLIKECPELGEGFAEYGSRFTHATSIAPTGTISLSLNNNASNGIEPTFAHHYIRNVIKEGKKSKEAVPVYSYEMLRYKLKYGTEEVPDSFSTTDNVSWKAHVDIQAVAQKWCDSSISKTINVPSDIEFEEFKDVYIYAYEQGLKGCTTFRFNPEAFQGVLVKEEDLEKTLYRFVLEDGEEYILKGNDMVNYEGEEHTAANLFDAHKENYYGKF
jgi:ribonucleoside-diphosphate reductase alpha chain